MKLEERTGFARDSFKKKIHENLITDQRMGSLPLRLWMKEEVLSTRKFATYCKNNGHYITCREMQSRSPYIIHANRNKKWHDVDLENRVIWLPDHHRNKVSVLHNIAHILVPPDEFNSVHSREWIATYLELLEIFLGKTVRDLQTKKFRDAGIKTRRLSDKQKVDKKKKLFLDRIERDSNRDYHRRVFEEAKVELGV